MSRPRVIPVLLMQNGGLYKTRQFKNPVYVGDPINTVRIFNDKEVDELILLDTLASLEGRAPDFARIQEIVSESFMPLAYGGGITRADQAMRLFEIGIEKIILGSAAFFTPDLIGEISRRSGSQSVVVSIDAGKRWLSHGHVRVRSGKTSTGADPASYARKMAALGLCFCRHILMLYSIRLLLLA